MTAAAGDAKLRAHTPLSAMSAEQLAAFWEAVEGDASLQETLKGAADLDAAVAVAKEAGFDVSKADLLEYQAQQTLELSDEDLEKVAGGISFEEIRGWLRGYPGIAEPPGLGIGFLGKAAGSKLSLAYPAKPL